MTDAPTPDGIFPGIDNAEYAALWNRYFSECASRDAEAAADAEPHETNRLPWDDPLRDYYRIRYIYRHDNDLRRRASRNGSRVVIGRTSVTTTTLADALYYIYTLEELHSDISALVAGHHECEHTTRLLLAAFRAATGVLEHDPQLLVDFCEGLVVALPSLGTTMASTVERYAEAQADRHRLRLPGHAEIGASVVRPDTSTGRQGPPASVIAATNEQMPREENPLVRVGITEETRTVMDLASWREQLQREWLDGCQVLRERGAVVRIDPSDHWSVGDSYMGRVITQDALNDIRDNPYSPRALRQRLHTIFAAFPYPMTTVNAVADAVATAVGRCSSQDVVSMHHVRDEVRRITSRDIVALPTPAYQAIRSYVANRNARVLGHLPGVLSYDDTGMSDTTEPYMSEAETSEPGFTENTTRHTVEDIPWMADAQEAYMGSNNVELSTGTRAPWIAGQSTFRGGLITEEIIIALNDNPYTLEHLCTMITDYLDGDDMSGGTSRFQTASAIVQIVEEAGDQELSLNDIVQHVSLATGVRQNANAAWVALVDNFLAYRNIILGSRRDATIGAILNERTDTPLDISLIATKGKPSRSRIKFHGVPNTLQGTSYFSKRIVSLGDKA